MTELSPTRFGVVGYFDCLGYYQATQVRTGGIGAIVHVMGERLEAEGFDRIRAWVDGGIAGGGYDDCSTTQPEDPSASPYNPLRPDERAFSVGDVFDAFEVNTAIVVSRYGVRELSEFLYRRTEQSRIVEDALRAMQAMDASEERRLEHGKRLIKARLLHDPENRDAGIRKLVALANGPLFHVVRNEAGEPIDVEIPEGVVLYPSVGYPDGTTFEAEEQHWKDLWAWSREVSLQKAGEAQQ
ncbi:hypothetical protein ACWG8W_06040 [Citricoccus zhacaiensis]